MKDFIKHLLIQFEEQSVSHELITSETEFREIPGYDSMTALMIIAMLDEEYNISISSDKFDTLRTVGELYNLIKR